MSYLNETKVNNIKSSAFGEVLTAEITPIVQIINQYGIDPTNRNDLETYTDTISSGSVSSNNNLFEVQNGTSIGGYGVIRSKDFVIYGAGQGLEAKFSACFTTGVANSLQFGGMFSLTETIAFGYDGANFSIIHEYGGKAEIQEIQVTTTAGTETGTVTVGVDIITVNHTIAGTLQDTAHEIEDALANDATFSSKWNIEHVGDTVVISSKSVGDKTGTFSYSSTGTAVASFTEVTAGVAKTNNYVAQSAWDKPTPFAGFDPTLINLYKIQYAYLGVATLKFLIYDPILVDYVQVHQMPFSNVSATQTNVGNPNMKIGWIAYSLGSTTNLTVRGASLAMAVEGKNIVKNTSFGSSNTVASIGTTGSIILALKNRNTFGKIYNLSKIEPLNASINNDHTKGAIIEIIKDITLVGDTIYEYIEENNSVAIVEKSGLTYTGGRVIESFTVASGGSVDIELAKLNIELLPNEILIIFAKTISGTATSMTGTMAWMEEK
jgi:hypothetical protein